MLFARLTAIFMHPTENLDRTWKNKQDLNKLTNTMATLLRVKEVGPLSMMISLFFMEATWCSNKSLAHEEMFEREPLRLSKFLQHNPLPTSKISMISLTQVAWILTWWKPPKNEMPWRTKTEEYHSKNAWKTHNNNGGTMAFVIWTHFWLYMRQIPDVDILGSRCCW